MDRLDAMRTFVAALDAGSLAAASRALGRSPAAVSRAVAALEAHVGGELLHRTTRALRLSEAGERYAVVCRRVLSELAAVEAGVREEKAGPRGILTVSAPPIAGEEILRPILEAFLGRYPEVSARLLLAHSSAGAPEESTDIALRVGPLPDSALLAVRVGGDVRRVVVAAPAYLRDRCPILRPADLEHHQIIALAGSGADSWTFAPSAGSTVARAVQFKPKLVVDTVQAALGSAVSGLGVTRLDSYQVAEAVRRGQLQVLLQTAEFAPAPVHLVLSARRAALPKVRAFLDFAGPRLRAQFARASIDAHAFAGETRPPAGAATADQLRVA